MTYLYEELRVKVEPTGRRPFGFVAYNVTVSTPRHAPYDAEYAYSIWARSPNGARVVKEIGRLSSRLQTRLTLDRIACRVGDFPEHGTPQTTER